MASLTPTMRPLSCLKSLLRHARQQKAAIRSMATLQAEAPSSIPLASLFGPSTHVNRKLKAYPPPPSKARTVPDPILNLHDAQISVLDPSGARTALFNKLSPEAAKVGDILLVRLKNGDPFAGVCINIRRRGVESAILLRNELTRVGVEMWFKFYSPNVEGIEIVQKREKRARRARLTYLRKPKHDMGSVQNIVMAYQRQKEAQNTRGKAGAQDIRRVGKKGKGKGKK